MVDSEKIAERLNAFLRGEIAAVETYRMALDKIQGSQYRSVLQDNLRSHERRVNLLRDRVNRFGGQPARRSGVWGAFAKLYQGGASAFGDGPALAALEEGEDAGLRQYRSSGGLVDLDTDTLKLVNDQILPEQERTHRALSSLKQTVGA